METKRMLNKNLAKDKQVIFNFRGKNDRPDLAPYEGQVALIVELIEPPASEPMGLVLIRFADGFEKYAFENELKIVK